MNGSVRMELMPSVCPVSPTTSCEPTLRHKGSVYGEQLMTSICPLSPTTHGEEALLHQGSICGELTPWLTCTLSTSTQCTRVHPPYDRQSRGSKTADPGTSHHDSKTAKPILGPILNQPLKLDQALKVSLPRILVGSDLRTVKWQWHWKSSCHQAKPSHHIHGLAHLSLALLVAGWGASLCSDSSCTTLPEFGVPVDDIEYYKPPSEWGVPTADNTFCFSGSDKFSTVLGKTSLCLGKPSVCQSSEEAWLVPMPWHPRQDLPAILDFLVAMS
jgi:hypothetical protein